MFGSQGLETAIGLVLMFFVIAVAASTIVELWSQRLSKRSKELETVVGKMLAGDGSAVAALTIFKGTSAYSALSAGATKAPSYISAKSFADAVVEGLFNVDGTLKDTPIPSGLKKRLGAIMLEAGTDLQGIKVGLESWFDGAMERMQGAYKRWATVVLFVLGLVIAVTANASTYDTAVKLWKQPVTRQVVADAAGNVVSKGEAATQAASFKEANKELNHLGLPVGWTSQARTEWHGRRLVPFLWSWDQLATALGWLVTALLVSLGAPFWFDLLTKLVALRTSGTKPATATKDPGSATFSAAAPAAAPASGGAIAGAPAAGAAALAGAAPPSPSSASVAAANLLAALS